MSVQQMYQDTLAQLEEIIKNPKLDNGQKYGRITDLMLFSRVDFMKKSLLKQLGEPCVQSGPFQGMRFHGQVTEGCYIPKLLGCYEEELHPVIRQISENNAYDRVINVGCAEGYYAVGLARCLPDARILAFDINPRAQTYCRQLAELNEVANRILVGGEVKIEDWPGLIDERVLIVADCEGAEYELLDPARSQHVLKQADFLIELHLTDTRPELAEALLQQYRDSHSITLINHGGRNPSQFSELKGKKHLDQLLAMWEFRGGPTPWVFMQVKSAP